jgi:transcriptional regulator NrdR family protein
MQDLTVVKRAGTKEVFDDHKVYASVYEACISAKVPKRDAEKICDRVTKEIKKWLKGREEIDSSVIFKKVAELLEELNKEAAFAYETHRNIT